MAYSTDLAGGQEEEMRARSLVCLWFFISYYYDPAKYDAYLEQLGIVSPTVRKK